MRRLDCCTCNVLERQCEDNMNGSCQMFVHYLYLSIKTLGWYASTPAVMYFMPPLYVLKMYTVGLF